MAESTLIPNQEARRTKEKKKTEGNVTPQHDRNNRIRTDRFVLVVRSFFLWALSGFVRSFSEGRAGSWWKRAAALVAFL